MHTFSLSPRPKTNPSADRFQYRVYTGSDIRAGWGLGTRLAYIVVTVTVEDLYMTNDRSLTVELPTVVGKNSSVCLANKWGQERVAAAGILKSVPNSVLILILKFKLVEEKEAEKQPSTPTTYIQWKVDTIGTTVVYSEYGGSHNSRLLVYFQ